MPIEYWDLGQEPNQPRALRSFAKIDPVTGHEFAVAIRPESNLGTPNRLVPRDNWRIVVEPRLGLGELEKVA
jgi:hypothetical protein